MAASTSAKSSYKSFLMYQNNTTWEKLVDVKEIPALGGSPEKLQTTTLSNKRHTYTEGIQETEDQVFRANYIKADYDKIEAMSDGTEHNFAVWLGGDETNGVLTPTGDDGKWSFSGMISVYLDGFGVNEVKDMVITITPTTEITSVSS